MGGRGVGTSRDRDPQRPETYPIDLPTALRLAGANNLQIALATERARQAEARLQGAEVLWLPSLQAGTGYNEHAGRIQDTSGKIIDTQRSGVFFGGGPNFGPGALTGGDGSSRLAVGVPLGDLLFTPLAERQQKQAADAARAVTFNDTLLQVGLAYADQLQALSQLAIARESVKNAKELVRVVDSQVRAGKTVPADGLRAQAELADRQRQALQAEEMVRVASAELARLLRLDPSIALSPVEARPVPLHLIDTEAPLPELIAQGVSRRPELAENRALVEATLARLRQERWRPFVPALQAGVSSGGYGGGTGTFAGDFGGRIDFDALLVWELKNLGFGNRALQRERLSQHAQARLADEYTRDLIVAEITKAYYQSRLREQQIAAARTQLKAAAEALPLNLKGILDGTLRAVEALQAVQALAAAQERYLTAIIDYNRAQFQLLRAVGQPLDIPVCDGSSQ
jgi:outer membrane protein TolC